MVLEEEAGDWFVGARVSPFMLFVYDVRPEKADRIPAVRHVDGTARIQTINRAQNPAYYDLIKAFQARTGVPVLVNTSFNTRGEPIVCTPARRGRVLLDLAARRAGDRPVPAGEAGGA